ncbi:hypothetical protein OROGR_011469 [Orobanche gracilis]
MDYVPQSSSTASNEEGSTEFDKLKNGTALSSNETVQVVCEIYAFLGKSSGGPEKLSNQVHNTSMAHLDDKGVALQDH